MADTNTSADPVWKYLKAGDAISGKEGTLYAIIDGQQRAVAECKNIKAKITKKKVEFKALGHRGTQYKAAGWSGEGTMVIHYTTSYWSKMMINYAKTGKDTYFQLLVENTDPTSSIGTQLVSLLDCNLDEAEIAKLDVEADFLDESMGFTFSDVDLNEEFKDVD